MSLKPLIAGMSQAPAGGGGGGSFDPHSPGPIGNDTPDTGAFTTISVRGAISALNSDGSLALMFSNPADMTGQPILNLVGSRGLGFYTGASYPGSASTVLMEPAANTLALRNGTNGQTLQVFASYTDNSNKSFGYLQAVDSNGFVYFWTESAGTGTPLGLSFGTNNTERWKVGPTSGHFLAATDNTYDIGAPGNAPKDIYVAGTFNGSGSGVTGVPGTFTIDTGWLAPADGGSKASALPSETDFKSNLGSFVGDYPGATNAICAVLAEVKALHVAMRDHVSPNA